MRRQQNDMVGESWSPWAERYIEAHTQSVHAASYVGILRVDMLFMQLPSSETSTSTREYFRMAVCGLDRDMIPTLQKKK
jgi:hypothetical protein